MKQHVEEIPRKKKDGRNCLEKKENIFVAFALPGHLSKAKNSMIN
jgi:hypothetical protein